jgi:hypothetical protein
VQKQRNVLTPVIIALVITLVLLVTTETSDDSLSDKSDLRRDQKDQLIDVPKEQASLEADILRSAAKNEVSKPDVKEFKMEDPFDPARHDSTSLVEHVWYRGEKVGKTRPEPVNTTFPLVIDTISVAAEQSFVTLQGQVTAWGSHHSVRYFFGATERDDDDPGCATKITIDDMKGISDYCSGKAWKRANRTIKFLRNRFARGDFMVRFRKTPGWMCAQKRFSFAVAKVMRFYRRELATDRSFKLPDYLLLQDDDTFYNMVNVHKFLETKDPSVSTADAGCLVRMPIAEIAFDYPYGGFGMFMSRAAIERWMRPIDCGSSVDKQDPWVSHVCGHLQTNLIGEAFAWKDGMSISDLMEAQASHYPYPKYHSWRQPGYCIHGDWALGYYVNYYGVTEISKSFQHANNYTRIEQTLGYHYDKQEGNCKHEGQAECTPEAHVCHRLHGVSMSFVARRVKQEFPHHFREVVKKKKI